MKKTLPKEDETIFAHATYPKFWDLYQDGIVAVGTFYKEKNAWAMKEEKRLVSEVERMKLKALVPGKIMDDVTLEDAKNHLKQFQTEVTHIQEFLNINKTALGKILKKYDKRTLNTVRDATLSKTLDEHPFFDGAIMDHFLIKVDNLFKILDRMSESYNEAEISHRRRQSSNASVFGELSTRDESIVSQAHDIIESILSSPFFEQNPLRHNPRFHEKEFETGEILGEGEYSTVREITSFDVPESCPICVIHHGFKDEREEPEDMNNNEETQADGVQKQIKVSFEGIQSLEAGIINDSFDMALHPPKEVAVSDLDMESFKDDHDEFDAEDTANRGFMKHHCLRDGVARYAIKQLKGSLTGTKLADGAIDLAIEAKFLSALSHPNIIRLCGTGGRRGHPQAFIILDRLYDTLAVKISKWQMKETTLKKGILKSMGMCPFANVRSDLRLLWDERVLAGYDIARAMKYIHSKNLIYRDLKPENIGFDIHGNAKIFDFGLVKELREELKVGKDMYRNTGRTGTRRYMAPEVVLCKDYGKPCDVYSFAILFWEMLSLKVPFDGYDYEKHAKKVVTKGKRPKVPREWTSLIKTLIEDGWSQNPADRPSFERVCKLVSGEFTFATDRTISQMDASTSTREFELNAILKTEHIIH